MTTRYDPERRRLLLMVAGFAATASAGPYALAALVERLTGAPPMADVLRSLVGHQESAARLGQAYLAVHPSEASSRQLAHRLIGPHWSTERDVRARVLAQMKRDFAANRTVRVDGWILSRAEARLYALVALG